ncbi:MAG: 3-oxo-tetronate kinase [Rhodospirillaceae bacterium]|nr:3-oxo-tetronate kinase [Rhodospirillaceae bacterium]
MPLLLGCIADDMTGATDLGSALVRAGMPTLLTIGVPSVPLEETAKAGAVVVALKSRMLPAPDAVDQSLAAQAWLQAAGAHQFLFKYCSTFDSTDAGNIGPVGDALLDATGERCTIVCPSYPANRRTVYQGNLFVGTQLLSESPMRDHPLTPMTDANLVRVLSRQTPRRVGLIAYDDIVRGPASIAARLDSLRGEGIAYAVVDAIDDRNLGDIAVACRDLRLVTGGAAIATGLVESFRHRGLLTDDVDGGMPVWPVGPAAIMAGSSSAATLAQVAAARVRWPSWQLDPLALADGRAHVDEASAWAIRHMASSPVLVYASAAPERLSEIRNQIGRDRAGALVEQAFAQIADRLVAAGLRRLIVAGGETSGAVVAGLGIEALQIGPAIAPGVPWTSSQGEPAIALALKSGNFGGPMFFIEALEMLP